MPSFTKEEYADILFVYGFCNGNSRRAQRRYQELYPNRRLPSPYVFGNTFRRLRETGSVLTERPNAGAGVIRRVSVDERILAAVEIDPSTSIRRLALQYNVSRQRISRILHGENMHPYHHTPVQELLPNDFVIRLEFCKWLLERSLKDNHFINRILWTDESQFTRDGITNFHNLHTWASSNPHSRRQRSFQRRFCVNMWAGVIGNRLIGPFKLPPRLNSTNYLEFLQNDLPGLLEDVPLHQRVSSYFQQDGAPAHYGREVKDWLDEKYGGRWIGRNGPIHWPARSPDLTVLDFFIWGRMKEIVYSSEITTLTELEQRISEASLQVRQELSRANIHNEIQKRALACVQNEGGHFEHFL
jgi:hypothetical protein